MILLPPLIPRRRQQRRGRDRETSRKGGGRKRKQRKKNELIFSKIEARAGVSGSDRTPNGKQIPTTSPQASVLEHRRHDPLVDDGSSSQVNNHRVRFSLPSRKRGNRQIVRSHNIPGITPISNILYQKGLTVARARTWQCARKRVPW